MSAKSGSSLGSKYSSVTGETLFGEVDERPGCRCEIFCNRSSFQSGSQWTCLRPLLRLLPNCYLWFCLLSFFAKSLLTCRLTWNREKENNKRLVSWFFAWGITFFFFFVNPEDFNLGNNTDDHSFTQLFVVDPFILPCLSLLFFVLVSRLLLKILTK